MTFSYVIANPKLVQKKNVENKNISQENSETNKNKDDKSATRVSAFVYKPPFIQMKLYDDANKQKHVLSGYHPYSFLLHSFFFQNNSYTTLYIFYAL